MKRRSTIYSLLGAVGIVIGLSALNPVIAHKSKENGNIAVSVVSYDKIKKNDDVNAATGEAFTATTQAIDSYASENVISSEKQKNTQITKENIKEVAATPKPTATPDPRKEIVKIAKSYKGKITYLWGGKPSDAQISGKDQPKRLDCSGFIQFVYSKYSKKRISRLGSTISISGLPEIEGKQLKIGDIGLRNGTGSLYFDADGKSYSEPQFAEEANDKKVKEFDKKIDIKKDKKSDLREKINDKKENIEEFADKMDSLKDSDVTDNTDDIGDVSDEPADEEELEEIKKKEEEKKKEAEKKAAEIKKYQAKIKKCKSDIERMSKSIKKCDDDIQKLRKSQKKYKKDIEKSIDHVGIYCGKNKAGKRVWCHCSSSKGGVVYEVTDIFTHYYSSESCIPK